jgi:hypothetical protein
MQEKTFFFLHYHNGESSTKGQNVAKKNVFVKPDDQSEICFSFGMARKGA